mgnify:CR=1 FL=1
MKSATMYAAMSAMICFTMTQAAGNVKAATYVTPPLQQIPGSYIAQQMAFILVPLALAFILLLACCCLCVLSASTAAAAPVDVSSAAYLSTCTALRCRPHSPSWSHMTVLGDLQHLLLIVLTTTTSGTAYQVLRLSS